MWRSIPSSAGTSPCKRSGLAEVGQVAHAVITIDFNYEEGDNGKFTPVVRNFVVEDLKSGKSKYVWTCKASIKLRSTG